MPELGQGPGGFIVRVIVIFSSSSDLLLIILKTIDVPQTISRYGIGSTELSCLSSLHLKLSNSLTRAIWLGFTVYITLNKIYFLQPPSPPCHSP